MRLSVLALLALAACADGPTPAPETPGPTADATQPAAPEAPLGASLGRAAAGALVYVPAYSHVYAGNRRQTVDLATTLSIRNTDLWTPIRVVAVRYVGSRGEALRSYPEAAGPLGPLATAEVVVAQSDRAGGSGASFLVEWTADAAVTAPVVEAVMINTSGQQGISFVTEGRVLAEAGRPAPR